MIIFWVSNSCKAKITNAQVTIGINKDIRGLEVTMKDVGRVNVLEATKYLIGEVTCMVVAQLLRT